MTLEVMEVLSALESNRPRDVEAVKAELAAMLSSVRDPWLVHGLVQYQMRTGSTRAAEVLARCPEAHARTVLDRLAEGVRGERVEGRAAALALLGYVVRRQPLWLHQIASHPLMSHLLKLLLTERDIATLMTALTTLLVLLPMIPSLIIKHFADILEVLKRLAAWDAAWGDRDDAALGARRAHLQLGLYALFSQLYGMYPCHLLDFLRREYGSGGDRRDVFHHTIRPMLDTVRLHPLLVTASKHLELHGARFQKMEHHDVLYECRRFSLEGSERAAPEPSFRTRCGTDASARATAAPSETTSTSAPNLAEAPPTLDAASIAHESRVTAEPGAERWFSLADDCGAPPSAPHTPLPPTGTPLAHLHAADGGSPPEAAIEATPENTPIKELGARRFNFPTNSNTVRALAALQRPPLALSQPPSPLKKEPSPFGRAEDERGKDRLTRVVLERAQADPARGPASPARRPRGSVPNSPIPIGGGAPAPADWPLARPEPQRDGLLDSATRELAAETNTEDREVTELTGGRDSEPRAGPADTVDDWCAAEEEPCERELCGARAHGLHMPPSASMLQLSRRLRFYSRAEPPRAELAGGSLPGPRAPVPCQAHKRLVRGASCPDLLKSKSKMKDAQTQTVERWPASYEASLADIFSGGERCGRRRATPAPGDSLDRYVEEVARAGEADTLSEQLRLTHAQLQYERHRKEVHAVRNRRLLGRCRTTRAVEERVVELADRLRALQAENDELRAQAARRATAAAGEEGAARAALAAAAERRLALEAELSAERRETRKLSAELEDTRRRAGESAAHTQHLLATQFDLTERLDRAMRAGEASERRAECVRALRRELLLSGEREARLAAAAAAGALAASDGLSERLAARCRAEAEAAQDAAGASAAQLVTANARAAELEAALAARDAVVLDLKRHKLAMEEDYEARVAALGDKYESLLRVNQRLESRVLELARPAAAARAGARGWPPAVAHVLDARTLHELIERPGPSRDSM